MSTGDRSSITKSSVDEKGADAPSGAGAGADAVSFSYHVGCAAGAVIHDIQLAGAMWWEIYTAAGF